VAEKLENLSFCCGFRMGMCVEWKERGNRREKHVELNGRENKFTYN
jgi:hypothetical protein